MCNIAASPSVLFSSKDDISRDVHTVFDSTVFDVEEVDIETDYAVPEGQGSCLMASNDCHAASIPVEAPSHSSPGYVAGIVWNPQQ